MKIFYTGNPDDERSIPDSNQLVFGGYTYCLALEKDSVSYNMDGYFPERRFSQWFKYQGADVAVASIRTGISPKSGVGIVYLDSDGDPVDFLAFLSSIPVEVLFLMT